MILAVWFSTCHMAIYTIFTGHGVWWWRFRRRRWEGGEGWISCGNIDSSSLSPSNLLPGWSSPPKLRRISKCSLFIVGSLPIVRLSFSSQMSTFSTRYVGAILARHCHCIFINEGNVLKATNGNELINEILICFTFKVERMGKVNKLITVAANELRKYLSVKDFGKNSRMNCSEPKNWETRSRYCGNV